jgi:phosphohistidine phosphatase
MKTLTLLRHAKAQAAAASDFDRPLNARGHRGARTMGRELRARAFIFDRVVASPAARVVETLQDVEHGYGEPLQPSFDPRLYLASTAALLAIVREADDAAKRLMIAGHNPGLEGLAMELTRGNDSDLRREMAAKFPTATLAEIQLPIDHWRDAEPGTGELTRFIRPRDLDPALGPEES